VLSVSAPGTRAADRPRGRHPLVLASAAVLAEARPIVGEGVVIEESIARVVQRGLRYTIDGLDVELRPGERLARPLGAPWVAVVARGHGHLVRRRARSCWRIRRVIKLPEDTAA
jgi:hypothetical protein